MCRFGVNVLCAAEMVEDFYQNFSVGERMCLCLGKTNCSVLADWTDCFIFGNTNGSIYQKSENLSENSAA